MIDNVATGIRLKEICEKKGISADDIKNALHLSDTRSVYYWFSGRYLPSIDNLCMLADLLQTSVDDLLILKPKTSTVPRI